MWAVFGKVMVPLDGSPLSEAVLPWVRQLMATGHTRAYLLRVLPGSEGDDRMDNSFIAVPHPLPTPDERAEAEGDARAYLHQVAAFVGDEWDVRALVREGAPAREIALAARECGVDLIAMSTHGRSGLGRLVLGSVADQVVRSSGLPVVLIHPDEAAMRATPTALSRGQGAVVHPGRRPMGL